VNRSLSVVVPVRNAERTLAANLQHILDVVSDLSEQFEVLIVDEGSTDHTLDVAHELSLEYPQLRVVHRDDCALEARVSGTGEERQDGFVVYQDRHAPFSPSSLRQAVVRHAK
jgi:glycosyltransferase involved in cell wall biosynthesis